jgi:glycosyltransferase involved in cell wall biosynthesis
MRILHVSDCFLPAAGGLERHVHLLAHANATQCEHVAVATLTPGPELDPSPFGGRDIRVWRLDGWASHLRFEDRLHRFHPTAPDPGVMRSLRAVIEQERPDVVHAHGWMVYSAALLLRTRPIGLVCTLHDHALSCAKRTLMRDGRACPGPRLTDCASCAGQHYGAVRGTALAAGVLASRRLLNRVDHFVAISQYMADTSRWATRRVPVSVIAPAVDDSPHEPIGRPAFLPDDDYMLFVGALGPHKGLDVLLEAYRRLVNPPRLVLLGERRHDTPDLPDDVIAPGQVDASVVRYAFAHARLAVAPSVWREPFGAVAVDAMLAQTPLIATRTGGLQEIVEHERTGLLVEPGSVAELADAIARLLADGELSRRLAAAALSESRRYGARATAEALFDVYTAIRIKRLSA